jgi:hypothetical protein
MATDTILPKSSPVLWETVQSYVFPVPLVGPLNKGSSFSSSLIEKCDLTELSALRLVTEYRRFLYLKALDGGTLTPSYWVDQAWHQHQSSPRYEEDMTRLFGGPLSHQTGMATADATTSYEKTLLLYNQEFGSPPPEDIWPSLEKLQRDAKDRRLRNFFLAVTISMVIFWLVIFSSGAREEDLPRWVALATPIYIVSLFLGIRYDQRCRSGGLEKLPSCG